jgi:hypothetical protein
MIEIRDTAGTPRILNAEMIVEVSPAPGSANETRVVLRSGAEYRLTMSYAEFRARLRTARDRMLPLDREVGL